MTGVDDALMLHEFEFALLPLRNSSKEPNTRVLREVYGSSKWRPLAERRASKAEVRAWYSADPLTGVGIITGTASNVAVLDIDRPVAGLTLPPTPVVKTSRGQHAYFRTDGPTRSRRLPFGDLKADGGYVAAPPSVHPDGLEYEWSERPDDVDFASLLSLEGLLAPEGPEVVDPLPRDVPAGPRDGEEIAARFGFHEAAVVRAMATFGITLYVEGESSRGFGCVLPGHGPDRRPSASLWRSPTTGLWLYRCWHHQETLTLADVRALIAGREMKEGEDGRRRLRGPERARWYDRLFYEAGLLTPDVPRLHLPSAPTSGRKAAEGFALLQALRDLDGKSEAMPYTREFCMAWSGLTERQARDGLAWMFDERNHVVVHQGTHKRTRLWRLHPGAIA